MRFGVRTPQQTVKKPQKEFITGGDLQRKTGKYVEKLRCVDRQSDRYWEIVADPETGEIIHRCDERLSDHKGHGSDKGRV